MTYWRHGSDELEVFRRRAVSVSPADEQLWEFAPTVRNDVDTESAGDAERVEGSNSFTEFTAFRSLTNESTDIDFASVLTGIERELLCEDDACRSMSSLEKSPRGKGEVTAVAYDSSEG